MPGISPCHKTNKPAHAASAGTSPRNKQLGRDVQEGACTLARRYFPPAACLDLKSVGQCRNDFGRQQKCEVIWRSSFPCLWGCALRGDLLEAQKATSGQDQQANCPGERRISGPRKPQDLGAAGARQEHKSTAPVSRKPSVSG